MEDKIVEKIAERSYEKGFKDGVKDYKERLEKEINKLKFSCAVSRYKGDKWYIQEEEILKIVNKKEEAKGE